MRKLLKSYLYWTCASFLFTLFFMVKCNYPEWERGQGELVLQSVKVHENIDYVSDCVIEPDSGECATLDYRCYFVGININKVCYLTSDITLWHSLNYYSDISKERKVTQLELARRGQCSAIVGYTYLDVKSNTLRTVRTSEANSWWMEEPISWFRCFCSLRFLLYLL